MKRILLIMAFLAVLITIVPVFAETNGNSGGFGYTGGVVLWTNDVSSLNSALKSQGFGTVLLKARVLEEWYPNW